jgi:hypothetical protein
MASVELLGIKMYNRQDKNGQFLVEPQIFFMM